MEADGPGARQEIRTALLCLGSRLRLTLYAVIALALIGLIAWAGWAIYDYGGLRQAVESLQTQDDQNRDLQGALVADREAEERDREQLEQAEQAASDSGDLDAPGERWLSAWLNCVHHHADRRLQSCAGLPDEPTGAGLEEAGAERDETGADERNGED